MKYIEFQYCENDYKLAINEKDSSGIGCVKEIVNMNDYILNEFVDLRGSIIDIGANCGVATIILAKQNPESIIYSFEPDPSTYKLLEENIKINNLVNVKLFNLAVSDISNKEINLFHSPVCSGGNTICSDNESFLNHFRLDEGNIPEKYISKVKTISFDDIVFLNSIKRIKLLKIDCEGAEFDIIPNSVCFKNGIVENMVGEFHNLIYNTQVENNSEKLLTFCRQIIEGILKISILTINEDGNPSIERFDDIIRGSRTYSKNF